MREDAHPISNLQPQKLTMSPCLPIYLPHTSAFLTQILQVAVNYLSPFASCLQQKSTIVQCVIGAQNTQMDEVVGAHSICLSVVDIKYFSLYVFPRCAASSCQLATRFLVIFSVSMTYVSLSF